MLDVVPDGERSPLYEAHHAPRYERQELIQQHQNRHQCRLVAVSDILIPNSVTLFEEALYDADPTQNLHVREAAHDDQQWRDILKYRVLGEAQVYEGQNASVIIPHRPVE